MLCNKMTKLSNASTFRYWTEAHNLTISMVFVQTLLGAFYSLTELYCTSCKWPHQMHFHLPARRYPRIKFPVTVWILYCMTAWPLHQWPLLIRSEFDFYFVLGIFYPWLALVCFFLTTDSCDNYLGPLDTLWDILWQCQVFHELALDRPIREVLSRHSLLSSDKEKLCNLIFQE